MARHRNATPSYLLHKQSGRGRLIWTDPLGIRLEKLLPRLFGSVESLAAKTRLELELAVSPLMIVAADVGVSISEVLFAFLKHAGGALPSHGRIDQNEFDEYKRVSRHIRELYGDRPAAEFGSLALIRGPVEGV